MEWKIKPHRKEQYNILKSHGIAPIFCTLLSNRDFPWVKNKEDIGTLIESPLSLLEDPTNIAGMEQVSTYFLEIADKDVVVFGDYDVDGVLSSFMCEKLLLKLGASSVDVYLPSRTDDGYGLNEESVNNFLSICKKDYKLVVILDCGSSSKKQIEKIKKHIKNAFVVIIDHHIIDDKNFSSNADCVTNPRLNDATPYCAGGLIYQLVRQCAKSKSIDHLFYIPYAAISTIADVCPLTGSNRIIVKNGLHFLRMCHDPGIDSLFKVAEIEKNKCTSEDVSFRIGPMINASGRIKMASKAFQLFRKKNLEDAEEIAKNLHLLNEERKKIQKYIADEAIDQFETNRNGKNSALLYRDNWNPSVVGIVASKIAERYNIPVICFGKSKDQIKGSARSINGINIKEIMDDCSHLFSHYGGHEMAAGAALKPEFLDKAWDIFNESVEKYKKKNNIGEPVLKYDYEVDADLLLRIDEAFCDRLSMLEPFGHGNEIPILRANGLYCREVKEWKSGTGAFLQIDNVGLSCFGFGVNLKQIQDKKIDVLFSLSRSFIDGEKWQIRMIDYHVI